MCVSTAMASCSTDTVVCMRSRVVLVPKPAPFHIFSLANCVWPHGVLLGTFKLRKYALSMSASASARVAAFKKWTSAFVQEMISFLRHLPYSLRCHLWLLRSSSDGGDIASEKGPPDDPETKTNGGTGSSGSG